MKKLWPYLTGLFSIVASTIIVYCFASGFVRPKGKRLDVTVQQISPLLNPDMSSHVDSLSLSVGTGALRNPQVVQLRFKNTGAVPIKSTDFDGPISIRFKGPGDVVAANVVAPHPADLSITPKLLPGNRLTLAPCPLDPGDSFVASVLYVPAMPESNATEIPIEVSGRITGVSRIGIEDVSPRRATRSPISMPLAAGLGALTGLLSLGIWTFIEPVRPRRFRPRAAVGEATRNAALHINRIADLTGPDDKK